MTDADIKIKNGLAEKSSLQRNRIFLLDSISYPEFLEYKSKFNFNSSDDIVVSLSDHSFKELIAEFPHLTLDNFDKYNKQALLDQLKSLGYRPNDSLFVFGSLANGKPSPSKLLPSTVPRCFVFDELLYSEFIRLIKEKKITSDDLIYVSLSDLSFDELSKEFSDLDIHNLKNFDKDYLTEEARSNRYIFEFYGKK